MVYYNKNPLAGRNPGSKKKPPVIIQNNTEYPKIYPGATPKNTIQKQKSNVLRRVDTVDNSLANNKIQSYAKSTPFINTPNKMYTNPATSRKTGKQMKQYTFLKSTANNKHMKFQNPTNAFYKRSMEKGKGGSLN